MGKLWKMFQDIIQRIQTVPHLLSIMHRKKKNDPVFESLANHVLDFNILFTAIFCKSKCRFS